MSGPAEALRSALARKDGAVLAPGCYDALTALLIERQGFEAAYLSGASIAYSRLGRPDIGLVSASEVAETISLIRDRCPSLPLVVDADTGFGNALNVQRTVTTFERAGASAIQLEDQEMPKRCGHLAGKRLVSTGEMAGKIRAALDARCQAATLIVARTDAMGAGLLTSDIDPRDHAFCTGERTVEGFFQTRPGIEQAIARGIAYAPYADLVWCETSKPDIEQARLFAEAVHARYPGKLLAYNCSPSFNWKQHLDEATIATFQQQLAAMGYKFQFITLAGFHALNHSMFQLARGYRERQMAAYVELQEAEIAAEKDGYSAVRHQREVGAGYFDAVNQAIAGGRSSLSALDGSTEQAQFRGVA